MANTISDNYLHPLDRKPDMHDHKAEIGTTLHEGAEGKFTQSVAGKIWRGASELDLQLETEQIQKGTGPGGYSKVARAEIKQLAELNNVNITSVHAPLTNGGYFNFTGLTREGFDDDARQGSINLLKRTIDFATDISTSGTPIGITQHVGEFQRSLAHVRESAGPNKGKILFETKQGEEEGAKVIFVDEVNGRFTPIERDTILPIAIKDENRLPILDKNNEVQLRKVSWKELKNKYDEYTTNLGDTKGKEEYKDWMTKEFQLSKQKWDDVNPDEAFLKLQLQGNIDDIEAQKIRHIAEYEHHKGTAEDYKNAGKADEAKRWLDRANGELRALEEIKKKEHRFKETVQNIHSQEYVGLKRTAASLGELGAYAFKIEQEKHLDKPVHIAPEIWTPDVFGSHPEEIAKIIEASRTEMVKRLTQKTIVIPEKVWDPQANSGLGGYKDREVVNNYYREEYDPKIHGKEAEARAKKIADDRIKMTFDTNHLGTWWENFKPNSPNETEESKRKRFDKWYIDHLKKLTEKGYIAHAHIVEGMHGSGMHLPPGAKIGSLPIKEAVDILRDWAFERRMHIGLVSEGHGEGPDRQLTEAWELTGRPLYALPSGATLPFQSLRDQYLHHNNRGVPYVFGEWSTSQDDFKSWSEVPLE